MTEHPSMNVELQSHTDCRSSARYNMRLSESRAESAAIYLSSKGIAAGRVTWKGYGETMLLNRCANGVDCSEEEHALNRRIEVRIVAL
jgi:outer membrane protein OmpA-like peptidoglycan-associated protein